MATASQLLLLLLSCASTASTASSNSRAWISPTAVVALTGLGDPRLLSVTDTFQGCANRTLLEVALNVTYVDLEEAMAINGWGSVEEACYSFCLSKEPFSERLSVAASWGNSTDFCGCHLREDLEELERVDDAICWEGGEAALYCGPADRACYNSAHCSEGGTGPLLLAVVGLLWAGRSALWK